MRIFSYPGKICLHLVPVLFFAFPLLGGPFRIDGERNCGWGYEISGVKVTCAHLLLDDPAAVKHFSGEAESLTIDLQRDLIWCGGSAVPENFPAPPQPGTPIGRRQVLKITDFNVELSFSAIPGESGSPLAEAGKAPFALLSGTLAGRTVGVRLDLPPSGETVSTAELLQWSRTYRLLTGKLKALKQLPDIPSAIPLRRRAAAVLAKKPIPWHVPAPCRQLQEAYRRSFAELARAALFLKLAPDGSAIHFSEAEWTRALPSALVTFSGSGWKLALFPGHPHPRWSGICFDLPEAE